MTLAIQAFKKAGNFSVEAIDAFIAAHSFPLVEGSNVTFLFRGEADSVYLQHWIYGLASSQKFKKIKGTDLWYLVMEIPPQSRVEYKIGLVNREYHCWIRDPLNPHIARDPFGANSVCPTEGYERPEWCLPDPEARQGSLIDMDIPQTSLGDKKQLQVYLPARFRKNRRYPLLIVHDGPDYLRYASLQTVLDNLIHRLEIPPMIVALTHSDDRLKEYAAHQPHARFIAEELFPLLEERFPLFSTPNMRALMGASFGGVAALSTAWYYPGMFQKLLLQSGSFAFTDIGKHNRSEVFDPVVAFVNRFRADPGKPAERFYISCGTFESLIYENRSMVPFLQSKGMVVKYRESRDGHNWENWRDRLREGLTWLFPGPLWMVYE